MSQPNEQELIRRLERANAVRGKHREVKEELRAERLFLSDALFSDADHMQTMKVIDLLLATPGVGHRKATRVLQSCWVSHSARLGRISPKTRAMLLTMLAENFPTVKVGAGGLGQVA